MAFHEIETFRLRLQLTRRTSRAMKQVEQHELLQTDSDGLQPTSDLYRYTVYSVQYIAKNQSPSIQELTCQEESKVLDHLAMIP